MRMPFGKFKGQYLDELSVDYLVWLSKNVPFHGDLDAAVKEVIHGHPDYASITAPATGATGASPSSTGKAKTRMDATARGRGFKRILQFHVEGRDWLLSQKMRLTVGNMVGIE